MIIKGKSITGPEALGPYLTNAETNERVEVLEVRGTLAQDLVGALIEMDAYAEGTKCEKPLYHGKINPEPPYRLSVEQALQAVDALEKELGLEGHARVIVMHEKNGRQHFHPVWARIDLEHMRAVPDSQNYLAHEKVARELERQFGHPRVQGVHAEREGIERPPRSPSRSELREEDRTGIKGKDVRIEVSAAFRESADPQTFVAALEKQGFLLARGDRRDFVIVDRLGGEHNLVRRIEGMNAADLRAFMKPIDRDALPTVERAKDTQIERQQGRLSLLDELKWENELAKNAIEKDRKDKKATDECNRAVRKGRREARRDDTIVKAYAAGDDFATQTQAATKDIKRRNKIRGPQPFHPSEHKARASRKEEPKKLKKVEALYARSAYELMKATDVRLAPSEKSGSRPSLYERMKAQQSGFEVTDRMARQIDKSRNREIGDDGERVVDRQNQAPGAGRSRSR